MAGKNRGGPKSVARICHTAVAYNGAGKCWGPDACFTQAVARLGLWDVNYYGVRGTPNQRRQLRFAWAECLKLHEMAQ